MDLITLGRIRVNNNAIKNRGSYPTKCFTREDHLLLCQSRFTVGCGGAIAPN
ncbi:hypothetical protein [[Limnothrix rosea] IAM M-220]|uniref:hypothetical protein n=1 Tax=[Limnothrix rosea] IAM M-220 TaxID=454133 RepID=UPI0015C57466|nr:hypothetical protein [[Limnothrix rosea] IAM M-220]